jgi:hypothetical protein
MDFNDWSADPEAGTATHASGFTLKVEGNPRDPSAVDPGKFPVGLSFADQARLLRLGLECLAKAAAESGLDNSWRRAAPARNAKTPTILKREAQAKHFAENPDKPKRSVLSLKKSS